MSKFSSSLTRLAVQATGLAALTLLAATPAQATLLSYLGEPSGSEIVTITNVNPASGGSFAAGQLQFNKDDGGVVTSLLAYCVDIFQLASTSAQVYTLVDGITHFGAEKADDIGRLFSGFDLWNTDNIVSAQETAALQLAVWEIANEISTSNGRLQLDLASGNFSATSQNPGTAALAQGWLNSLPGVSNHYQVSVYENATYQDQLVLNKVPEPGSVTLMFGALGAMGLVARRRKNAAPAPTL